jgi:hypothetical protein
MFVFVENYLLKCFIPYNCHHHHVDEYIYNYFYFFSPKLN